MVVREKGEGGGPTSSSLVVTRRKGEVLWGGGKNGLHQVKHSDSKKGEPSKVPYQRTVS